MKTFAILLICALPPQAPPAQPPPQAPAPIAVKALPAPGPAIGRGGDHICLTHGCCCGCLQGRPCKCGAPVRFAPAAARVIHAPAPVTHFRPALAPPPVLFRATAPRAIPTGPAHCPT